MTSEQRRLAITKCLQSIGRQYVPQAIRSAAKAGADPAEAARNACEPVWGIVDDFGSVVFGPQGLEVRVACADGNPGIIPWAEVAAEALGRRRPEQTSLLD